MKKCILSILTALVLCLGLTTIGGATVQQPSGSNVSCNDTTTGSPITLANACQNLSDDDVIALADARSKSSSHAKAGALSFCSNLAKGGDADAAAVCGNLTFVQTNDICAPYFDANSFAICKPKVDAKSKAYCGAYVDAECDPKIKQVCGNAKQVCGGDNALLQIALKLGDIQFKVNQDQEQTQNAAAYCDLANETSYNASQTCEAATQTCGNQTVSVNNPSIDIPQCPDTNVVVTTKVLRCKKVKTRPDGTVISKGCLVETSSTTSNP